MVNKRVGITQGRLTDAGGKIQQFPNEKWREEFSVAKKLGFDYVELVTDPVPNKLNPLWSGDKGSLSDLDNKFGDMVYSLTVDHIMSMSLTLEDKDKARKSREYLFFILENASKVGVEVVVLPFLEGASLKNGLLEKGMEVIREIGEYVDKLGIKIAIECDLSLEEQLRISKTNKNIFICYDTGNRTYFGFIPKDEIPILGKQIIHVHIKDKTQDGTNIMLGEGMVDFPSTMRALKSIDYKGGYTLETSRGKEEVSAAIQNLNFLRSLI